MSIRLQVQAACGTVFALCFGGEQRSGKEGLCKMTSPIVETVDLYRCCVCRARYDDEEDARKCCHCPKCGQRRERAWCHPCADKEHEAREKADFDKAKKIALGDYEGEYVNVDGLGRHFANGADEGGYLAVDALDDAWAPEDRPAYVWGVQPMPAPSFDLSEEIQRDLESEYHESVIENVISGGPEIEQAQTLIKKALARGINGFETDRTVAVLLPKR